MKEKTVKEYTKHARMGIPLLENITAPVRFPEVGLTILKMPKRAGYARHAQAKATVVSDCCAPREQQITISTVLDRIRQRSPRLCVQCAAKARGEARKAKPKVKEPEPWPYLPIDWVHSVWKPRERLAK